MDATFLQRQHVLAGDCPEGGGSCGCGVISRRVSHTDHLTWHPPPVSTPSRHRDQAFACLSRWQAVSPPPLREHRSHHDPPNEKTPAPSRVSATYVLRVLVGKDGSPDTAHSAAKCSMAHSQPGGGDIPGVAPGGERSQLGSGCTGPSRSRGRAAGLRRADREPPPGPSVEGKHPSRHSVVPGGAPRAVTVSRPSARIGSPSSLFSYFFVCFVFSAYF